MIELTFDFFIWNLALPNWAFPNLFLRMRQEHKVREEEEGRHLRSLLEEILLNVPAKGIRRAIQRGQIVVNKSRVSSNQILTVPDLLLNIYRDEAEVK